MKWNKIGLIFKADGQFGWMNSHTQVPTIIEIPEKNSLRIYFSTRPRPNLSHVGFIDVDAENPKKILYIHDRPILEHGPIGAFDEHGVMPQFCMSLNGKVLMYYLGWSRRLGIPYSNWVGLATSNDQGLSFTKSFHGPILDRTRNEIFSTAGLFAIKEDFVFRGWYVKGLGWTEINGRLEERYLITEANSLDGLTWTRDGRIVIPPTHNLEAMTRPVVLKIHNIWHMWYCSRSLLDFRNGSGSYRIGYAISNDGHSWCRRDHECNSLESKSGWDSLMQAYPFVIRQKKRLLLFYCGNGFGLEGLGVAELNLDSLASS